MPAEQCEYFSHLVDYLISAELTFTRRTDLGMMFLLNAKEREHHEWPELFQRADPRFKYLGARRPPDAMRWIIDAEWQG